MAPPLSYINAGGYSPEQIAILKSLLSGKAGANPLGKGVTRDMTPVLGPPPVGTYDSALDYNSSAAARGLTQTQNDANTSYEQGQQDYGLGLGDLTRGTARNQQDIGNAGIRASQDWWTNTNENTRQYGILGRQQAEGAAQRGVTSAGLLGKSAAVRAANQARDQTGINTAFDRTKAELDTAWNRSSEDYTRGKLGLDVANSRQFGGFNGNQIINPLTGKPEVGTLLTGTQRAATENDAYQGGILGQKIQQAQQGGYISPLLNPVPLTAAELKARAKAFAKKARA